MAIKNRIQNNVDMTQGDFVPLIIKFAIPLILGDLFQQLYNLTDTWVLGNFASNNEYAAVGATTYILNLVIKSFLGLSTGAGAIVARSFGSGDKEKTKLSAQTAFVIALVCCVIFSVGGVAFIPLAMKFTKVPTEIYDYTYTYLKIIFSFASAQVIYNMGAGILRAIGDTRKPFYYLVVASFINVVLDLYFVIEKGMGVRGVAYATVIGQCTAALLVVYELFTTSLPVKLEFKQRYDKELGRKMIALGLPTSLQMCVGALSGMFTQSFINGVGVDFMSGYSSYHKVEELLFMSANSFGVSSLTLTSQNLGAKKYDRIEKGIRKAAIVAFSYCFILISIIVVFAPQILSFFNDKPEVLAYSVSVTRIITPFFFFFAVSQCFVSALRGMGNSTTPLLFHIFFNVGVRVAYLAIMNKLGMISPTTIALSYPGVWVICCILLYIMYKNELKKVYRLQK